MPTRQPLTLAALLLVSGCASLPQPRVELQSTPMVQLPMLAPHTTGNGSIHRLVNCRPPFEDQRARLFGDTVIIQIAESISATQSSSSELDKSGSLSGSITALPGINPSSFGRATIGATTANASAGKGSKQNTNAFTGTNTAFVTAVLPNGHLMITGEKQSGVNSNVDVLRFPGQVAPRAILSGNSVSSASVANVRIEQRGRGALEQAHGIGWFSRFFLSVSPT